MSRSLSVRQAILLGAMVFLVLGLAAAGLFAVGSQHWPWNDGLHMRVGVPHADGVQVGTRVRVQGVDAGEIVKIEWPARFRDDVLLTLRLSSDWRKTDRLRADASAYVAREGMMGARVIEIDRGTDAKPPLEDNATIAFQDRDQLRTALKEAGTLLKSINEERNNIHQLVQNTNNLIQQSERTVAAIQQTLDQERHKIQEVVQNTNEVVQQGKRTMVSIQKIAEALQRLPIVRSYVEDEVKLLYRPECDLTQDWFAEADLFKSGSAQLTPEGMKRLEGLAGKYAGLTRQNGAELVVVACADPKVELDADQAKALTQKQSEEVLKYLSNHGAVYKKYWVLAAKNRSLGLGHNTAALPDKSRPKAGAVGMLVFVPRR